MTLPQVAAAIVLEGGRPELPDRLRRELRRSDAFIRLTVAAAHAALAGLNLDAANGESRTGLFLGTCFGPMQCNFDVLDALVDNQPVSPTLFSHSVFNAAAGYISRLFSIHGCAWTVTSFGWPFLTCLQNSLLFLRSGRLDRAVVVQAETYSDLLQDARASSVGTAKPWNPAAVAWVLDRTRSSREAWLLAEVQVDEQPGDSAAILERQERILTEPGYAPADDPLAVARYLTGLVTGSLRHGPGPVRFCSGFGSGTVLLQRGE